MDTTVRDAHRTVQPLESPQRGSRRASVRLPPRIINPPEPTVSNRRRWAAAETVLLHTEQELVEPRRSPTRGGKPSLVRSLGSAWVRQDASTTGRLQGDINTGRSALWPETWRRRNGAGWWAAVATGRMSGQASSSVLGFMEMNDNSDEWKASHCNLYRETTVLDKSKFSGGLSGPCQHLHRGVIPCAFEFRERNRRSAGGVGPLHA